MFGYRPESINREQFFTEVALSLSKAVQKYERIVLAGDLNVDMDMAETDTKGYLADMCDMFNLTNIINKKTCTKRDTCSSLGVFLTTRPKSFMKTSVIETGLSDHHILISTFLRSRFQRLPPKNIRYRDVKHFDETLFLKEVKEISFEVILYCESPYDALSNEFRKILDKHAPLKQKKVRGNQSPFVTKELRKAIMDRSRHRNRYNKWKSRED